MQEDNSTVATTIYAQTKRELDEFFNKHIHIAGTQKQESARYLDSRNRKYMYNQWETLNLIDLYYNSKFESGPYDTEGQRKLFLNICKFRSDVAAKQIDLDVKDFNFIPEDGESVWPSYFMQKEFKYWAKENYFGELLNTCVENFPKYGWLVLKEVKGDLEFVPLQTLRNQQDAKNLNIARYVIIEHPHMTLNEMKQMKGWDTSTITLKLGQTETIYERYGFTTVSEYNTYADTKIQGNPDDMIDTLSILTLKETKKGVTGNVLFMEQIDSRPFQEVKWSSQYGRVMGIGEVENQFENQIGANLAHNLFRRQLLWSSKKVFQSTDDGIAKNLVRDVKDGDVLQIGTNGNITQVDMSNKAIADFQNFAKATEANADQKSFTFEAATGASMASGTPFRLGVLLSNAVNSHFDLKREELGLFFKRAMKELIVPKWKSEFDEEHIISMFADEEGFETLKDTALHLNINDAVKKSLLAGKVPDIDAIKAKVQATLDRQRYIFVKIPDSFYKDIDYKVTLTITGEDIDIPKKIETLTNLFSSLQQTQDPRADKVLNRILALAGENYDVVAGPKASGTAPGMPANQPLGGIPSPLGIGGSAPRPTINPHAMPATANKTM